MIHVLKGFGRQTVGDFYSVQLVVFTNFKMAQLVASDTRSKRVKAGNRRQAAETPLQG